MLDFLPAFLRVPLGSLIIVTNTALHCLLLFGFALVKFLVPVRAIRTLLSRVLILIAESWIAVNGFTFWLLTRIEWQVEGLEGLRYDGWYLVLSNHQSWVDIPVLQKTFNRRIPFLKFFLKQELIWVPVLGLAWWALDFPFMKRYSKEFLKKHPDMRGKDLETTRAACEKFRHVPVSVMNFVEGTRFNPAKREKQQSPFVHLLRPKAGGVAFVLNAMGDILQSIVDVTIVYPEGRPTFVDTLSGRLHKVRVFIRELPIPRDLLAGDYENDPAYRERFQGWVTQLWGEKDAMIERLLAGKPGLA
jgi:1-acyl-sn-glycerol-3-phosphate acyltransferase